MNTDELLQDMLEAFHNVYDGADLPSLERAMRAALAVVPLRDAETEALRERLAKSEAEAVRRERLFCEAIVSTQTNAGARLTCDVQDLLTHYNKARDAELGKENSNE